MAHSHDHAHAHGGDASSPDQLRRLSIALALTAQVRARNLATWPEVLAGLRHEAEVHGIGHATFQPELIPWAPLVRQD